jgi:hypothetical protein
VSHVDEFPTTGGAQTSRKRRAVCNTINSGQLLTIGLWPLSIKELNVIICLHTLFEVGLQNNAAFKFRKNKDCGLATTKQRNMICP